LSDSHQGIVIDARLLSALRRVSAGGHGEQHARPPVSFFELAVAHPATYVTLPPHHPTNIKL